MRAERKGVVVDIIAKELHKQGLNIWHIWEARSFENLFWAINKDCKKKYVVLRTILSGV